MRLLVGRRADDARPAIGPASERPEILRAADVATAVAAMDRPGRSVSVWPTFGQQ
jgi:hypothetical protein